MPLRALAGVSQHNHARFGLIGRHHNRGKVVMESCCNDEHRGTELVQRHEHLFRGLGLGHNAHLIFHGKHFCDARPEDCLVIGQNQFEHVVNAPRKSSISYEFLTNSYESITQATPRPSPPSPVSSARTTRPLHWMVTFSWPPVISGGNVISNSTGEPISIAESARM